MGEIVPTGDKGHGIAVVIVTHQGSGPMVQRCVESVRAGGPVDHLVLVDNSGTESSPDLDVDIAICSANRGFGAAFNAGLEQLLELPRSARPDLVALLNDDVQVSCGWLDPLVAQLALDDRVGAVQPKLILAGDQPRRLNSVGVTLGRDGAGVDVGYGEVDGSEWAEARGIEMFTGGAVLFSVAFLEDLAGFDERFFLYYEDVDLALRGTERGWRFRCDPESTVMHAPGSSTGLLGEELVVLKERNRIWIALRFGSIDAILHALWLSVRRVRHVPRGAHMRGLFFGLAAAPRLWRARKRGAGAQ